MLNGPSPKTTKLTTRRPQLCGWCPPNLVSPEPLDTGGVFINGITASDPRVPVGGVKNSGYGRELSHFGAHTFVNAQTCDRGCASTAELGDRRGHFKAAPRGGEQEPKHEQGGISWAGCDGFAHGD